MTSVPDNDDYPELLARVAAERGLDVAPLPAVLAAALPPLHDEVARLLDELREPAERRWLAAALAALAHHAEAASLPAKPAEPGESGS